MFEHFHKVSNLASFLASLITCCNFLLPLNGILKTYAAIPAHRAEVILISGFKSLEPEIALAEAFNKYRRKGAPSGE
jgi:hypothetical protein